MIGIITGYIIVAAICCVLTLIYGKKEDGCLEPKIAVAIGIFFVAVGCTFIVLDPSTPRELEMVVNRLVYMAMFGFAGFVIGHLLRFILDIGKIKP